MTTPTPHELRAAVASQDSGACLAPLQAEQVPIKRRALCGLLAGCGLTGPASLTASLLIAGAPRQSQAQDRASDSLPRSRAVPGGVVALELGPSAQAPKVTLNGAEVLVMGSPQGWTAVAGIGLSHKPGKLALQVQRAGSPPEPLWLELADAGYTVQSLRVPQRQVDLSPKDLARYRRESAHLAKVKATRSATVPASLRMAVPVAGPRSGSFGLRRVFNGQARSPHSGMDIAAPEGTPITAPLPGRVIDTGDYFFSGQCLWLDHGSGVLSLYAHLSRFDAQLGQDLQTGQTLGAVGATGRVTGPHLHWSVMLNGQYVDPALFLDA
jgi:murein DD-endopeptidase MepM/ murein hydrolase activator NlpD